MGSEFLKTVFDALLAMASCDGELHEDEVEVLEAFKVEFLDEIYILINLTNKCIKSLIQ